MMSDCIAQGVAPVRRERIEIEKKHGYIPASLSFLNCFAEGLARAVDVLVGISCGLEKLPVALIWNT